jgi:hypothetical protein
MASDAPPASWLSRVFGGKESDAAAPSSAGSDAKNPAAPGSGGESAEGQTQPEEENKKGLLRRIFGIFGGSKKDADKPNQGTQDPQH